MVGERYGFVRDVEADFLDRLLETIKDKFGYVRFLEIGVFGGGTVTGVVDRCKQLNCSVFAAGVDFAAWKPNPIPLPDYAFYSGDSMDMWREIPTDFQCNLLFIDGCHCVVHASQDFLHYSPFVENCGFVLFHDTALPKGQFEQEGWPQDHSYAGKNPSKLGVREALVKLGLLQSYRRDWKLIEEVPSDTGLMGMALFQKTANLSK